jgi:hypothetical protein
MSKDLFNVQQFQMAIRDVLMTDWDPIGVGHLTGTQNEYDGYVADIYQLVSSGSTQREISVHLWKVATEDMGLSGDKQRTDAVARRLFEMGQASTRS